MATAARRHAFRILVALESAGPTLADLLADDEVESLAPRDRAFLHELRALVLDVDDPLGRQPGQAAAAGFPGSGHGKRPQLDAGGLQPVPGFDHARVKP